MSSQNQTSQATANNAASSPSKTKKSLQLLESQEEIHLAVLVILLIFIWH